MVGLGFAMFGLGLWSLLVRLRKGLPTARLLQRAAVAMAPSGFVAVLAGWITTEAGRQPYTVYGLLRTVDSASPIAAPAIGASLAAFAIIYFAVFGAGVLYVLRQMSLPPQDEVPSESFLNPESPLHAAGLMPAPAQTLGEVLPGRKGLP